MNNNLSNTNVLNILSHHNVELESVCRGETGRQMIVEYLHINSLTHSGIPLL